MAQTERLADELRVQKEIGGDRAKIDLFQKSIFGSHDLHVLAWQKIGSPHIQLVHSAREFHVLGGVSTLKGKLIRFVGDIGSHPRESIPMQFFSLTLGWTWKEVNFVMTGWQW